MSNTMMLSKHYDPKKCSFPVFVSEKLDGVPGVYAREGMQSRQGKPLLGVQWIHDAIKEYLPPYPIVGEHWRIGEPFQYISGKCRKAQPWLEADLFVFDLVSDHPFEKRLQMLRYWYDKELPIRFKQYVHIIPQYFCETPEGVQKWAQGFEETLKVRACEGMMVRPANGLYTLTRSWASQKYVFDDLLDLRVCAYEEAIDQYGTPKGMVGAIWCADAHGKQVKVGAGKMKHAERILMFESPALYIGRICKVKAKPDLGYDALRQGTWQAWHEDKEEPDVV